MAGPAQPTGAVGHRGAPKRFVCIDAGAGEGAVGGTEIPVVYVHDHGSDTGDKG